MLPDVASALSSWTKPFLVKRVSKGTVDFIESDIVTTRTVNAVVQPAQKEKLSAMQIDWSLKYIQVHTDLALSVGEFIEVNGEDYKIIDGGDYQSFGYTEAIAEQTKKALI